MTTDLTVYNQEISLAETMTLGETLALSGYFRDAKQAAQAVVKVLAGRELGFGPIASMTGINIIQGKVSIGANLLAATVKRDPRYDYKVITLDDSACELAFFENGQEVGRSSFTMTNARETKYWNTKTEKMEPLASKFNWQSYPRNMLFARAMSNGVRWYCPDAVGGSPVYTPDELGAQIDDQGQVIDVQHTVTVEPEPTPELESNGVHWIDKTSSYGTPIRTRFWAWAKSEMGLTEAQVYEALDVARIHDYEGSMAEAKAQIYQYTEHQIEVESAEPVPEVE